MAASLTLSQAWDIRAAVGSIAALARQPVAVGYQRSALAIAARRASNEAGIAHLATATQAIQPCALSRAGAREASAVPMPCPQPNPRA